jgi:hypothetical protein
VSRRYLGGLLSTSSPVATTSTASGLWTLQQQFVQVGQGAWPGLVPPSLYAFTDATFTPGGQTGSSGPSLTQARTGLTGTGVDAWKNNTSYFNTSSGILLWTVPSTGVYRIEAWGARGGDSGGTRYGLGARMRGDFSLTQGQLVRLIVGQSGGDSVAGGGGGGTYVFANATDTLPFIAAGGGGGYGQDGGTNPNGGGQTGTSGSNGVGGNYAGGTGGNGGVTGFNSGWGGAGAGWLSNGTDGGVYGGVAYAPRNGAAGGNVLACAGAAGGFGGGGGGGCNGGGAGGGYSGGGCGGGGGGSYNGGSNQSNSGNVQSGPGQITITKL